MKWIVLAIFLAWMVLADGDVVVLTDENFDEYIKNNHVVMVKFFAPWCGHCKTLAPEYEKLAKQTKDKSYVIGELDATVHTTTAGKFEIRGYPTLKLFIDGVPIDYEGERKMDALLAFIDKKVMPASTELKNADEVKARIDAKGRRCILVSDNEEHRKEYMSAGRSIDEFSFYHVAESIGKEVFPEITNPSIVVLRDFDEKKLIYSGAMNPAAITAYLRDHQLPLVAPFDQESVGVIFQKAARKGIFLIAPANLDEKVKEEFSKFATEKKSKEFLFVIAGSKDEWGQRLVGYFGLSENELPVVEIVDTSSGEPRRYRHQGEMTLASLVSFLNDYKNGKLEKFMKSEEIPTENPGPVLKVVGKTFQSEVINNDMDVLVKFYAEWCGHCKKLVPIYEAVAETLKNNKKLRLVEIDSTKNDVEGVSVHSFPTIYFYKAGEKGSPIKFEADRTEEGITKFLQENCANPIELPKKDL